VLKLRYRLFGKTGLSVSVFGLGCMRFPTEKDADGNQIVEKDKAFELIHTAINEGVNYFDTAYPYHGGQSEPLLGEALSSVNREEIFVATKSPVWKVEDHDDFERFIDKQLERLRTDYIDFYLLHSLNRKLWDKAIEHRALDFLEKIQSDGRAKHVGFSFHDNFDVFKEITRSYDWDMLQIQLNFLDQHYQAGLKGLEFAAEMEIPVVVMEPLRGGRLAEPPSKEIAAAWNKASLKRKPVEWAFRWLYNRPEVNVILSGVSTMEHLKEDIAIFDKAEPRCMTEEELRVVEQVRELYDKGLPVRCTGCNYCIPCPSGVEIASVFNLYNNASLYNDYDNQSRLYKNWFVDPGKGAEACVECGQCEEACPQELPVIKLLKEAHSHLITEEFQHMQNLRTS